MGILSWFLPKERDFYKMLSEHSAKTLEGMKFLSDFFRDSSIANADRVFTAETEADDIRLHLTHELYDSFITPIDREDIFKLSESIDNIVDYAKKTVREIQIYKIIPSDFMIKIGDELVRAAKELDLAINQLNKDLSVAREHARKAKKVENYVEILYHEALVKLFENPNIPEVFKKREVYRHLSNSADRCAEAGDIIMDIAVKLS